jgi:hypothetical protein
MEVAYDAVMRGASKKPTGTARHLRAGAARHYRATLVMTRVEQASAGPASLFGAAHRRSVPAWRVLRARQTPK